MSIKSFQELIVWQKAMDLVEQVYLLTKALPTTEIYALISQMRRAAVSIPSNIAEGQARNTTKDFVRFLFIAKGSNAELHTQLILCERLNYLTPSQTNQARQLSEEVAKILNTLINKLTPAH